MCVTRGQSLGLLGPNGSGKTTTLKLISTALLPDEGAVFVNGLDARAESTRVRRSVGFALAAERSFFPRLTAFENLQFFAAFEDVPGSQQRLRIETVLENTGLQDIGRKLVMKFSSGMMQRLAIARALLKQPSILLLDEPTRSLDPAAAEDLWALVRGLCENGITVILATHNFAEAAAVCDRVAILRRGELLAHHSVHAGPEELRQLYFLTTEVSGPVSLAEGVPA
jgi:ABC-2 type transport system ATP-binding protein